MVKITNKDSNYLAKVVKVENIVPIEGANTIQIVKIDFMDVITSKEVKEGDIMVYFPVECTINKEFVAFNNEFRDATLNNDPEKTGFFDDNARVRAVKMMSGKVRSFGYLSPVDKLEQFSGEKLRDKVGERFDTVGGKLICEKYVPKNLKQEGSGKQKQGRKPQVSRLIDGQVRLHVNTSNLRYNVGAIKPNDIISITYKTHGTSWWVGNLLAKKQLNLFERILKLFGVNVVDTEYDLLYGSRNVVKNKNMKDSKASQHFYDYDLWEDIKDHVGDKIPKGYTLYGEMLGYTRTGAEIQPGYDYGCSPVVDGIASHPDKPGHKLEVYRITNTNQDGFVTELTYPEIKEFCDSVGLKAPDLFFYGKAVDWLCPKYADDRIWELEDGFGSMLIEELEKEYNEKDCYMCVNPVPEEGIVVRKESLLNCESYKLKSPRFLNRETEQLDKGVLDMESEN